MVSVNQSSENNCLYFIDQKGRLYEKGKKKMICDFSNDFPSSVVVEGDFVAFSSFDGFLSVIYCKNAMKKGGIHDNLTHKVGFGYATPLGKNVSLRSNSKLINQISTSIKMNDR